MRYRALRSGAWIGAISILPLLSGCGWFGAAPVQYQVHLVETVPSTPQPLNITWQGVLRNTSHPVWTQLREQIGSRGFTSVLPPSGTRSTPTTATVAQEALMWTHTASTWPSQPLLTVPMTLTHPLRVSAKTAQITKEWHTTVKLGHQALRATVLLTATLARPHGVLQQAQWTWIVSTPAQQVKTAQGTPYRLPALNWTERGKITRQ